jgi:preprotein translocase subunit SecD
MRLLVPALAALVLAAPASAAGPRFGLFDLDSGLARASHTVYGDVKVSPDASALARKAPGATVVRCGDQCRLGTGFVAFSEGPLLTARDIAAPRAHPGLRGWNVSVTLTAHGRAAWARLSRTLRLTTRSTGLQPVLAIVLDGTIYALPFASDLRHTGTTLELAGFTPAGARHAAALLR